ncbi:MAG: hypothetical protein ACON5C_01215 [Alphaproteobacteria bacterium]
MTNSPKALTSQYEKFIGILDERYVKRGEHIAHVQQEYLSKEELKVFLGGDISDNVLANFQFRGTIPRPVYLSQKNPRWSVEEVKDCLTKLKPQPSTEGGEDE